MSSVAISHSLSESGLLEARGNALCKLQTRTKLKPVTATARVGMRQYLETSATVLLAVCAITVTGLAMHHELGTRHATAAPAPSTEPVEFKDWRSFEETGRRVGPTTARAVVTEFVDYECPFCRSFGGQLSEVVADVEKKHPGQIATVFVHYPLPMHRFSKMAGQVLECADAQGRFSPMQNLLLAKQDSFGLKPWPEFASEAGLGSGYKFANCLRDSSSAQKVNRGYDLARKLKLQGTPTILVNGWQFNGIPTRDELHAAIERVLRGSLPFEVPKKNTVEPGRN